MPDSPSQSNASPPASELPKLRTSRERAKAVRDGIVKASELPPKLNARPAPTSRRSAQPLWNGDDLRLKLQQYERTPFLDVLASFMECIPTPQTIMAFADKYPDRWAKALSDLGRLGGFADRKEVDINLSAKIARMSDSQIMDALRDSAYKLGMEEPKFLELEAHSTSPHEQRSPSQK